MPSYRVGGYVNGYKHNGPQDWGNPKINVERPCDPAVPLWGIYLEYVLLKNLTVPLYSWSTSHSSEAWKQNLHRQIFGLGRVCSLANGILLIHKKEKISNSRIIDGNKNSHNNLNNVQQKKTITVGYTFYLENYKRHQSTLIQKKRHELEYRILVDRWRWRVCERLGFQGYKSKSLPLEWERTDILLWNTENYIQLFEITREHHMKKRMCIYMYE